jgi:hypothetical protein
MKILVVDGQVTMVLGGRMDVQMCVSEDVLLEMPETAASSLYTPPLGQQSR